MTLRSWTRPLRLPAVALLCATLTAAVPFSAAPATASPSASEANEAPATASPSASEANEAPATASPSASEANEAPAAASPSASQATEQYVVQTSSAPVASYIGDIAGYPATKPPRGKKVEAHSPAAQSYGQRLNTEHDDALRKIGADSGQKVRDYGVSFNGFAANLNDTQATKLASTPGVLHVWKNEIRTVDTVSTPTFLGLEGSGGTWAQQFGGDSHAGEGIIVGVIDTGIWPENPSFGALPEPRPDQPTINDKWHGICDPGTTGTPVVCNNKLIGARYYTAGGLNKNPAEFQSPRDFGGHGSHTSSTAAGDHGVTATINGQNIGSISGMAPAARIAMYKALWQQSSGSGSGTTLDLVDAINDAVADGVDVINYSISGSRNYILDPVEVAFMHAADAGVFVAASAGNSGPAASTVAHNSPWITTVAASTHDRASTKSVTLGNGASYTGVGVGPAVAQAPLIDSATAPLAPASAADAELCKIGSLDPAKITGKIVLCKRGFNARVDKSKAVRDAGGTGMVLYNNPDSSLNADFHFVPTVHLNSAAGLAIKAYAATSGATASLAASVAVVTQAPQMAAFSSAGPALAGSGDLLKPDITAPGVDVIAAVAPPGNNGNSYDAYSGTSMSSPHMAGIAALIMSKNPDWSPMWVKSALMTTAGQTDNTGAPIQRAGGNGTPLDFGAGHVKPGNAFDPGLVYDSDHDQWIKFACAIGELTGPDCDPAKPIAPSDLNYPSISVGKLAGTQTITRTVTNITNSTVAYDAQIQAPTGFTATVAPAHLAIEPGKVATFTVTLTRTDATIGKWAFGSLTWSDQSVRTHSVRSPIAVRPVALAAPATVTGAGISGTTSLSVKPGFSGTLNASVKGLAAANVTTMRLVGMNTSFNSAAPATGPAVGKVTVTVPVGSPMARFATFDADYPAGTDLDLYVYKGGTNTLVGSSTGPTAEESVTVTAAGTYDIYIVQYALAPGLTEQNVKHYDWVVGSGPAGNLTATPAGQAVTMGTPTSITLNWNGLTAATRYLGVLAYGDGGSQIGTTTVMVNT